MSEEDFELLTRKRIFPYEYIDCADKLQDTRFTARIILQFLDRWHCIRKRWVHRAANNRVYSTWQHFAMLALLHAASYYSRFRNAVRNAYRQRLPYEFHAHIMDYTLSTVYLKAPEFASNKIYLALCHPFDIQDWAPSICSIYRRSYVYGDYIDYVWDKLLEHVKADSKVRTYLTATSITISCGSERTSKIKDCSECQRRAAVCWIEQ